jgi:hypothetical protein
MNPGSLNSSRVVTNLVEHDSRAQHGDLGPQETVMRKSLCHRGSRKTRLSVAPHDECRNPQDVALVPDCSATEAGPLKVRGKTEHHRIVIAPSGTVANPGRRCRLTIDS